MYVVDLKFGVTKQSLLAHIINPEKNVFLIKHTLKKIVNFLKLAKQW